MRAEPLFLPEPDEVPPPTPEEIARREEMVKKLKKVFAETEAAMRKSGRITGERPKPRQIDDPEKRMQAIENLQAVHWRAEDEHDG